MYGSNPLCRLEGEGGDVCERVCECVRACEGAGVRGGAGQGKVKLLATGWTLRWRTSAQVLAHTDASGYVQWLSAKAAHNGSRAKGCKPWSSTMGVCTG